MLLHPRHTSLRARGRVVIPAVSCPLCFCKAPHPVPEPRSSEGNVESRWYAALGQAADVVAADAKQHLDLDRAKRGEQSLPKDRIVSRKCGARASLMAEMRQTNESDVGLVTPYQSRVRRRDRCAKRRPQ
jgi:hypothetical protein